MIIKRLRSGDAVADEEFDSMYNYWLKAVSAIHFTPVAVAQAAARFLVSGKGTRVLDVGSGAGKFCMVGAACTPGTFTGIEQRRYLYRIAGMLSRRYELDNTGFIHANVLDIDFRDFDAVYYFNAFYENIVPDSALDSSVALDKSLYRLYSQYMKTQLAQMPVGTRLATYFSFLDDIPAGYELRSTAFDVKLKLWEKRW